MNENEIDPSEEAYLHGRSLGLMYVKNCILKTHVRALKDLLEKNNIEYEEALLNAEVKDLDRINDR